MSDTRSYLLDLQDRFFVAIDFGYEKDVSVKTTFKRNKDDSIEIVNIERFGRAKDFEDSNKREEYLNNIEKQLSHKKD